jgi:hypothetical protein
MLPEGFSDCQLLFLLLQNKTKESWRDKLAFVMLAPLNKIRNRYLS